MGVFKINLNSVEKVKAFVNKVSKCEADVLIFSGRYIIDAKSVMGIFSLDLSQDVGLSIETDNESLVKRMEKELAEFIVE